jgi:hypothetical protein
VIGSTGEFKPRGFQVACVCNDTTSFDKYISFQLQVKNKRTSVFLLSFFATTSRYPASYPMVTGALFFWPERKTDHSFPSSADMKN